MTTFFCIREDPYPFARDEAFDTYRLMIESCMHHINLILVQGLTYFSWQAHRNVWKVTTDNSFRRLSVCSLQLSHVNAMFLIFDISGGTLAVNVVIRILELRQVANSSHQPINLPLPTAMVLNYAALDFNFTSWMSANNLRVLRSEQSSGNLPGLKELAEQKDHLKHVVSDHP